MPVDHQPRPWTTPVTPVVVERRFHQAAPYAAGGHRGIDLRIDPGGDVSAPCRGIVTFRGRVGGGPPTVTIACGALRATLQRVDPSVGRGATVRRGQTVGTASARALDLSTRRRDGSYLDPLPLLGAGSTRIPAAPVTRRAAPPERRKPSRLRPAHLPAGSLIWPAGSDSVAWHGQRPGRRSAPDQAAGSRSSAHSAADRTLVFGAAGAVAFATVAALGGLGARMRRRHRDRPVRRRAHLVGVRR